MLWWGWGWWTMQVFCWAWRIMRVLVQYRCPARVTRRLIQYTNHSNSGPAFGSGHDLLVAECKFKYFICLQCWHYVSDSKQYQSSPLLDWVTELHRIRVRSLPLLISSQRIHIWFATCIALLDQTKLHNKAGFEFVHIVKYKRESAAYASLSIAAYNVQRFVFWIWSIEMIYEVLLHAWLRLTD